MILEILLVFVVFGLIIKADLAARNEGAAERLMLRRFTGDDWTPLTSSRIDKSYEPKPRPNSPEDEADRLALLDIQKDLQKGTINEHKAVKKMKDVLKRQILRDMARKKDSVKV